MADDVASLRATAHPLRLRMLSLLTAAPLSAAEVARELDVTHANASYHLRLLLDAGLIVVESEERIRGGVAKRYRYRHDLPTKTLTGDDLAAEITAMGAELARRFVERTPGRGNLTDAELWVDPDLWDEVLELVTRASTLLHDGARPPRTEGTIRTNLTVAAFRMQAEAE